MVYTGKRELKNLVQFVEKEMEKAQKDRVKVNYLVHLSATRFYNCECVKSCLFSPIKIDLFSLCLQEDEDRKKYAEALKEEREKNDKKTKDEL